MESALLQGIMLYFGPSSRKNSTTSKKSRTVLGLSLSLLLYLFVFTGSKFERVLGSPLSQERFRVTTFGAQRRSRWSLEGKTAVVTGGTKVRVRVWVQSTVNIFQSFSTQVSACGVMDVDTTRYILVRTQSVCFLPGTRCFE